MNFSGASFSQRQLHRITRCIASSETYLPASKDAAEIAPTVCLAWNPACQLILGTGLLWFTLCSLGSKVFCRDDNHIQSPDRNLFRWLLFRLNCAWRMIFVLSDHSLGTSDCAPAKPWSKPIVVDQDDWQSAINPRHRWSILIWSFWAQCGEGERNAR